MKHSLMKVSPWQQLLFLSYTHLETRRLMASAFHISWLFIDLRRCPLPFSLAISAVVFSYYFFSNFFFCFFLRLPIWLVTSCNPWKGGVSRWKPCCCQTPSLAPSGPQSWRHCCQQPHKGSQPTRPLPSSTMSQETWDAHLSHPHGTERRPLLQQTHSRGRPCHSRHFWQLSQVRTSLILFLFLFLFSDFICHFFYKWNLWKIPHWFILFSSH